MKRANEQLKRRLRRRTSRPVTRPLLAIYVNGDWRYYDNGRRVEIADPLRTVVRVGPQDQAAAAERRSRSAIYDLGKRLVKAKPEWRRYGEWIAFAPQTHKDIAKHPVIPVVAVLTGVLSQHKPGALICLPMVDDLEALCLYRRNREVSGWTVVMRDDRTTSADQLLQVSGMGEAPTVVLDSLPTLMGQCDFDALRPYPMEPEWMGIPTRAVRNTAAGISLVAAAASTGALGLSMHRRDQARDELQAARVELSRATAMTIRWNRSHAIQLVHRGEFSLAATLKAARAVAVPGGTVDLGQNGNRLTVFPPLIGYPNLVNGKWVDPVELARQYRRPAPRGWSFHRLVRSGGGSRYALVYVRDGSPARSTP